CMNKIDLQHDDEVDVDEVDVGEVDVDETDSKEDDREEDNGIYDDNIQPNEDIYSLLFEDNSYQSDFNVNLSSDYENVHQHHFVSQLIDFIHTAKLNKTTTTSLLSLLRTTKSFTTDIPKTSNSLWEQLGVKFIFKTYYFCSFCFKQLDKYQDICTMCNSKQKANAEFCVFSPNEEIERVVKSTIDIIKWYSVPENQFAADVIRGEWYQRINTTEPRLSLMICTDGKPIIRSKRTRTSIWPVISFLAEIPPPLREDLNNILLLGLWHGPVAPPSSLLLNKVVDNIKLLAATEIIHFMVNVQLSTGDFPARAKCNQLINHNGFYACARCLFEGSRCPQPCTNHTLYKWIDFIQRPPKQRTQQHINTCAQQISAVNKNVFGVAGISPLSSVLSIPDQSTFDYLHLVLEIHFRYLLSEWHNVLKQNPTALNFINECLDDIKYPHTFNRRPVDFSNYIKWKASELRTFMIYTALPVLYTGSMTPGRIRKISPGISNTQRTFDDDMDDCEIDENELDGSTYYTPQLKRKRIQDQVTSPSHDPFTENPTPSEPPRELPVIVSSSLFIFSPTPAHLMKSLINDLFTKEEIMAREHENVKERTEKIKRAVKVYFFQNDDIQVAGFWDFEGKIIRENQRRGVIFRNK
ncbi:unnamed protein product, partial [Rotaria sp. Silwood1]